MGYTLGTAAKATGKSRTSILRAIQTGKVSANKNPHGEWDIDPSELHRVYPAKQSANSSYNSPNATQANTDLLIENKELKAKLEATEQRTKDALDQVTDLRHRLDTEAEERRKLTALLTDQRRPQESRAGRSWWSRLFGAGAT